MEIKTEIIINASVERIWNKLITFDQYNNWNPFILNIKGNAIVGNKIKVQIKSQQSKSMIFTPIIKSIQPFKVLSWLGHLYIPGLFDGYHKFELIDNKDGSVLFIHSETFRGILVPLFKTQLKNDTKSGFEAMNKQLKLITES